MAGIILDFINIMTYCIDSLFSRRFLWFGLMLDWCMQGVCRICGKRLDADEEDEGICRNCQASMIESGMV